MASPIPPVAIQDSCSVVENGTLYVYSPDAFQALPLEYGGTWSQLPNGVAVTGATCVLGTNNGTGSGDALWIVGGAANTSQPNYPGLQKYYFKDKTWETVTSEVKVTQNRRNHAAVFLNQSASILVYAGSQNDISIPSSETFVISTSEPYTIQSFTSKNPPALSPLLLQWNETSAIILGGSPENKLIYQFSIRHGWQNYSTQLQHALKSPSQQQSTLVTGSDASKVLETFDFSVSPNEVSRVVLQDANGHPAPAGQYVGLPGLNQRKKDLSLNNWPVYNATNAPNVTRSDFSLAQNPAGLIAVVGGNAQNPLALYNEQTNAWEDTSRFFGAQSVLVQSAAPTATITSTFISTSISTPTSISTSPSTSSPNAAAGSSTNSNHPRTSLILGAILGSVLGFIAVLILLLLILRWRKKSKATQMRDEDEKQKLDFADRGVPFMKEAGGAVNKPPPSSHSSFAIVSGKALARHSRGGGPTGSDSSTSRLVPARSLVGGDEAMEMDTINDRKSTGTPHTVSSHDCNTHGPTEIPPLNLGQQFSGTRVNDIATGSPPTSPTSIAVPAATFTNSRPTTTRPHTLSSTSSRGPSSVLDDVGSRDDMHDESTQRTSFTQSDRRQSGSRRTANSSVYTQTPRNSVVPATKERTLFPTRQDVGFTRPARTNNSPIWPRSAEIVDGPLTPDTNTTGSSNAIPSPMRASVILKKENRPASVANSDLSWLNLGAIAAK